MLLNKSEIITVENLLSGLRFQDADRESTQKRAQMMIEDARARKVKAGQLDSFMQKFGLNTQEGVALMALAEALLRVPDAATANRLIEDKIAAAQWLAEMDMGGDWLVKAAGLGLSLTRKTLDSVFARLGQPVIRQAIIAAVKMMGKQFVLGETIVDAADEAQEYLKKGYAISYDLLGEGARTAQQAETYFKAYIDAIGVLQKSGHKGTSISVKLSALHPRYSVFQEEYCFPVMVSRLLEITKAARKADIPVTVDAEEADRLEISLRIIKAVFDHPDLAGWNGFGLAVQAYQKRASQVIDYLASWDRQGKILRVRLVKGAYWDSEIKRAQMLGLDDYPVFTRKVHTDLSYLACAQKLLDQREIFYPMFGTHNAYTVSTILTLAGGQRGFEFQRLQGMGDTLYDAVLEKKQAHVSIYAPVGSHAELLAYLARRLLENGANTSFVAQLRDTKVPIKTLITDPVTIIKAQEVRTHSSINLPVHLYGDGRQNAKGYDLADEKTAYDVLKSIEVTFRAAKFEAAPVIGGTVYTKGQTEKKKITNPAKKDEAVGYVIEATSDLIEEAFRQAKIGFQDWAVKPAVLRASVLRNWADMIEDNTSALLTLLVHEAGKTIPDGLADIREAVDFCRYYAMQGEKDFQDSGFALPGPTGESNHLRLKGRGIFICISPWNFPLAIFVGQIAAALMAGNAVIAKPAEQTPLIAALAVNLLLRSGVSDKAITFMPGDGKIGAALIAHHDVAGVAFTGSTEVARLINRTLAAKEGPIVPLIAETGGQNVMIADSTALPEQVLDDVMLSAFGSAGQRCSACRVLYVQEDIADKMIVLLQGAVSELVVGNPALLSTDIGPVIDQEAAEKISKHINNLQTSARFIAQAKKTQIQNGYFIEPVIFEISNLSILKNEVFGPVLHLVRYKADKLEGVIADIHATGFGLTFGVQSRIDGRARLFSDSIHAGNIYVNRSMIGAVVGVQPFGGQGLSGTGPKAGGPFYLHRFATEQTVTINTSAAGGNAKLVSLED